MSALDIFRNLMRNPAPVNTGPTQTQQQVQQPNATNNFSSAPANPTQAGNGTAPNSAVPTGNYTNATPLDNLKDFWQTPTNDGQDQTKTSDLLDLTKLQEAANKADFSGQFDPEQIKAVLSGGENAATALVALLNSASRIAYAQSTVAAGKINQHTLGAAEARLAQSLPNQIRGTVAKQELLGENPAFANPAVSPLVDLVTNQLQSRFPGASPQEINQKAKDYLQTVAGVFNPQKQTNSDQANPSGSSKGEPDWSQW